MSCAVLGSSEYGDVTHYRVSAGKDGGQPVTVRIGRSGVLACLTCYSATCRHVAAVRESLSAQVA